MAALSSSLPAARPANSIPQRMKSSGSASFRPTPDGIVNFFQIQLNRPVPEQDVQGLLQAFYNRNVLFLERHNVQPKNIASSAELTLFSINENEGYAVLSWRGEGAVTVWGLFPGNAMTQAAELLSKHS